MPRYMRITSIVTCHVTCELLALLHATLHELLLALSHATLHELLHALLHAMQVPWGASSTETVVRLQVAVLASPNDMLAEKQFTPFMGPGGDAFCSQCNYHKKKTGAGQPFSFLKPQAGIGKPAWKLRTQTQLNKQLDVAWSKGKTKAGAFPTEKKGFCQDNGLRVEKVRCVSSCTVLSPSHHLNTRAAPPCQMRLCLVMCCSATMLFIPSTCRISISSR